MGSNYLITIVPKLICSEKCMNNPALILHIFSCTFDLNYIGLIRWEHISSLDWLQSFGDQCTICGFKTVEACMMFPKLGGT